MRECLHLITASASMRTQRLDQHLDHTGSIAHEIKAIVMYMHRFAHEYLAPCTRTRCLRGGAEMAIAMHICRRVYSYVATCAGLHMST